MSMNSLSDTLLSLLLDPNVIFLLFIVALILFLFGSWFLSPNWAGLALMALAFVLLILDVKLPAHGILTLGAVIALITGAFLFFNSGRPSQGPQLNPILVFAMC